jgi:ABC-type lipoprotein release transport system permease subunit
MAAAKYPVKGIVKFAQPNLNDGLVYLPLNTAQNFLSAENRITSLALSVERPSEIEAIQKSISMIVGNEYEVLTWKELMPGIENHIRADAAGFNISIGILYLIIAFGIFGTLLMMIAERKYEFGMLIAIGMKKFRLGTMLLIETILISVCGTAIGMIISAPIVLYLKRYPIRFSGQMARAYEQFGFEPIFPASFNPNIFITQGIIVLIIALIIGAYPLWLIKRLNPVTAMRK